MQVARSPGIVGRRPTMSANTAREPFGCMPRGTGGELHCLSVVLELWQSWGGTARRVKTGTGVFYVI